MSRRSLTLLRALGVRSPGSTAAKARSLCSNPGSCSGSSAKDKSKNKPQTSIQRPAPSPSHDWIGPPNPVSNLRPIVFRAVQDQNETELRLRALRQETEDWNHRFWAQQNVAFTKEKESFVVSQLKSKGLSRRDAEGRRRSLDSEEMAVFYKGFLDENRVRHAAYNKEWYRRNFTITLLMARVTLTNLWKSLSANRSSSPSS